MATTRGVSTPYRDRAEEEDVSGGRGNRDRLSLSPSTRGADITRLHHQAQCHTSPRRRARERGGLRPCPDKRPIRRRGQSLLIGTRTSYSTAVSTSNRAQILQCFTHPNGFFLPVDNDAYNYDTAMQYGADAYLTKAIDFAAWQHKIQTL